MTHRITRRDLNAGISAALVSPALASTAAFAQGGGAPIKIGFSMAQTGALAGAGKQALLGAQIWEEEINTKGGLLGRPVKLIYYDDQTKPDSVPGIYAKLLDVDKVDLVIGPYGTNLVAPAIPSVMGKGKVLVGLFALDAANCRDYGRGRRVLAQCSRRRPRERS
jgi:branched-chain amino acid transport system substrate-binding protein